MHSQVSDAERACAKMADDTLGQLEDFNARLKYVEKALK
jgi:hypothetical protein